MTEFIRKRVSFRNPFSAFQLILFDLIGKVLSIKAARMTKMPLLRFQLILFDLIGKGQVISLPRSRQNPDGFQLILFDLIGKDTLCV